MENPQTQTYRASDLANDDITLQKSKFVEDADGSDTSDLPLHGQQAIEGLEYDDDCLAVQTQNDVQQQQPQEAQTAAPVTAAVTAPAANDKTMSAASPAVNIKLPSMTQVYDLASNVGTCIEPLSNELGQNRLEPLTKSIIQMLNILETTVSNAHQLQKIVNSQHQELAELRTCQSQHKRKFDEMELDYAKE
jgi:hypothetical protein